MAGICHQFVQNAWKKDLCSNCFKSKEEHNGGTPCKPRYLTTMYPSRAHFWKAPQSILKDTHQVRRPKASAVHFPAEESQVIGFGGDECYSSDGEDTEEQGEDAEAPEGGDEKEEDSALEKLTRSNTDFNTNLSHSGLQLGKPLTDAEGKRKTLLVTVTPFMTSAVKPAANHQNPKDLKKNADVSVDIKEPDTKLEAQGSVNKPSTETDKISRIPVIKTRPKPAGRKSNLIKRNVGNSDSSQTVEDLTLQICNKVTSSSPSLQNPKNESQLTPTICTNSSPKINEIKIPETVPSAVLNKTLKDTSQPDQKSTQDVPQSKQTIVQNETKESSGFLNPVADIPESCDVKESSKAIPEEANMNHCLSLAKLHMTSKAIDNVKAMETTSESDNAIKSGMDTSETETEQQEIHKTNPSEDFQEYKEVAIHKDDEKSDSSKMFNIEESRELAGEPDGRADPDEAAEPPALPRSPPPVIEPHPSFLHTLVKVKPKIPAKPTAKLLQVTSQRTMFTQLSEESERGHKRQAPKPPEQLESSETLPCPEPAPRKSVSVSPEVCNKPETDNKKKSLSGKTRFSLKKFLRLGSKDEKNLLPHPQEVPIPRPRLEIIHPSDLSGSNVEVVKHGVCESPTKPLPPPRNQSLAIDGFNRPARPPPPKSSELLLQQKQLQDDTATTMQCPSNLYANLGEVRLGLTPSKPHRSSSIRDTLAEGRRRRSCEEPVYECVQYKRSASLPYCSSEADSDIYSPYSLYSEDVGDNESEWSHASGHPWKSSKLRLRKGRSVVHRSLEDNYSAVIVANHEALAQVLEHVNFGSLVPSVLRGLKLAPNLRWSDFTIQENMSSAVGRRVFHAAMWGSHPVTLSVSLDQSLQSRGYLCPLAEFSDLVPGRFLPSTACDTGELLQASVGVLPRMQVDSIQSYGNSLRERFPEEERCRDGSFVLLQLINALKNLQAEGVEETSVSNFALCRDERDAQPRLCVLRSAQDEMSLCCCALQALDILLPLAPHASVIRDLLQQERAVSLSQVKSVLEFSLWGPADISLGAERETELQHWLDLERATILHGLVRSRIDLTAVEECHLLFLVRTSAKTMCEASLLLSGSNSETTTF